MTKDYQSVSNNLVNTWEQLKEEAESTTTPKERLEELSNCTYDSVKMRVARNPNTPVKTLCKLACDPLEIIRQTALERL